MSETATPDYQARLDKWVEDLRSDRYKQGQGHLCQVTGILGDPKTYVKKFCCLGVACDTIPTINVTPLDEAMDDGDWEDGLEFEQTLYYDGNNELPPSDFYEWFGLGDYSMEHVVLDTIDLDFWTQDGSEERLNLASMNDSGNFTFDQIADCVAYFGILAEPEYERRVMEKQQ